MQVSFPYLIVYLENYVGVTKIRIQHHRRGGHAGQRAPRHPLRLPGRPLEQAPDDHFATILSSLGGILLSLVTYTALLSR